VSRSPDLRCQELVEMVTDYLERKLPAADRVQFEQHVMYCDWCEEYLEQMKRTIEWSGQVDEKPSAAATEKLRQMFRNWRG
jgi:hypothetical protein